MTHKERILKAAKGELPDIIPYAPRIDLWYAANALGGTLPERHRDRTAYEISRAEGWALQTATVDYTNQPFADALLHRAIGIFELKEHVFKVIFSDKIKIHIKKQGEHTTVEYHTPIGMVRTTSIYSEEMRKGGVSLPWVVEHIIKKPEDYRIAACLFENMDLVPHDGAFRQWQREVGEDGLCAACFTNACSPMHHIQKFFIDETNFFFHYKDHREEMQALCDSLAPLYDNALRLMADSPAEAINWGGNFDDMITYAPYFEKEFVPGIRRAAEVMEEKGKLVFCHCDGENQGLMNLIRDSGMHVAESVCPYPMTRVKIEQYYRHWREKLTIQGGIPSTILLPQSADDHEFKEFLEDLFKGIVPGDRFIASIADTTPPDADFERLVRIGEMVAARGRLPLECGAARPLTESIIKQAAQGAMKTNPTDDLVKSVQEDVFDGNEKAIEAHILELIGKKVDAAVILQKGLIAAMEVVGAKFKGGQLFIPEVLLSSRAMNQGLGVLGPYLSEGERESKGKFLIGTVKGDLHDIGKNMVGIMLRGVGFDVIDIGIDVPPENFIREVNEKKPHILGMSALLTTTMPQMKIVIEGLINAGLRDKIKIMVGGAPVNQKFADDIGADAYAHEAGSAVELAKALMNSR